MKNYVMGVDPGYSGGVAIMDAHKMSIVHFKVDKLTWTDIKEQVAKYSGNIDMCFLEKVGAMPKQGVSSTFKFGKNFGFWIGLLTGLQIPVTYVVPSKWQRRLGCLSKGDKNVTKNRAQELFPKLRITHATADALLIAEYGRLELLGEP